MKILKWFKLSLLAALATMATFALASCKGKTNDEDAFTGFLKGAQTEVEVGTEFNFKDFVDIVSDSDYKITVSNDQGFSDDITRSKGEETHDWALGKYTITYEVLGGENEGTYTFEFKVVPPRLKVFTTVGDEDMVMHLGQPLVFEKYFQGLNLDVRCYNNQYTVSMQSVVIGDVPFGQSDTREVISLEGQTSFTPTIAEPHYFTMKVVSLDGQVYTTLMPVRVAVVGDQVETLLKSDEYKNMSIYAYNAITNDMGVTFRTGFTRASNARNDIGYVGFRGEYGKGTYVKVDFTGNNLPKVAFFANPMVNGLTGGEKGLLFNNGTVRTVDDPGQKDCEKFGIYGPNKLSNASYNGSINCLWDEANSLLAWNNLKNEPNRQYTYIVGVKDCKDASQTDTPYVIFEIIVLDRETEGVIYEKTIKIENKAFTKGYFTGNVQLYGAFGAEITFDKVYPIATGIESIDEMYESGPKFASTAKKTVSINQVLTVQEYIGDDLRSDAVFGYINIKDETDALFAYDNDGNKRINTSHPGFVQVTSETFSIANVGTYKFLYQIPEEKVPGRMSVVVSDPSLSDFENGENNVIVSFGTYSSDGTDGKITIAENVGAEGNHALKGYMDDPTKITSVMNFNFNSTYLEQVFGGENSAADYITFDLLCDVPYLRFAREGGAYYDEQYINPDTGDFQPMWVSGNTYLVADANDVGFAEYTEKIEYNGQTLYRFNLVYRKEAWLKISNNGTFSPDKVRSTVAIDFSADIDKSGAYIKDGEVTTEDKFNQTEAKMSVFYIDNVRTGKFEGKDITFANGEANGSFIVSKAGTSAGAVDVVKHGDDYALQVVAGKTSNASNSAAFGLEFAYLHQVFNVNGAKALTFKVYYDPETIDPEKAEYRFLFYGSYLDASNKDKSVSGISENFLKDAFDATENSITYTITKEVYSKYFDANGTFKTDTIKAFADNGATFTNVRLGMKWTKDGDSVAKGTTVYFDDFKVQTADVILASVSASNLPTQCQGTVVNLQELVNNLTINVTSHAAGAWTAKLLGVTVDGAFVDLSNATEYKYEKATKYSFVVAITAGESTRTFNISFNVDYESVYEGALIADKGNQGETTIALSEAVTNVKINGESVAAENVTVTATGITFKNAFLANFVGAVQVTFALASGETKAANLIVYPSVIDFEDGQNYVISSFGTYASDGKDGAVKLTDNVATAGNMAVEGVPTSITNLMNVNFNTTFLYNVFAKANADYFTFDMICDLPYLAFVREGGSGAGNIYLAGEANSIGFTEYTEKLEYNGQTLYRFSLAYKRSAWDKISVNGTADLSDIFSTVVFDFSADVDKVGGENSYTHTTANMSVFYIDNIRIGNFNGNDITFENGVVNPNVATTMASTTMGSTDVVKFGEDYALRVATKGDCTASNTVAFAMQPEYLHEVFNVNGANIITFKVYFDPATIDAAKTDFYFHVSYYDEALRKTVYGIGAPFLKDAMDTTDNSITYTITKELYHTYFDANGEYIANSISGVSRLEILKIGAKFTKNGYSVAKGTEVYFDDFKASNKKVIDATISADNVGTLYQGAVLNIAELRNQLTITVNSHAEYTAEIAGVTFNDAWTDLTNQAEYRLSGAGTYVFTVKISTPDESVRNVNFSISADYQVGFEDLIYLEENATGMYEVNVGEAVTGVTLNGEAVSAENVTLTATGFAISNALLAQAYTTHKVVYTLANGEMKAAMITVCKTFSHNIDFENGEHYNVVLSYNNYNADGAGGSVAIANDIGTLGNTALKGVNTASQTIMCVQINRKYLDYVFLGTEADWFTFDVYMDVPAFGWARVGNAGNYYLAGYDKYGTVLGNGLQSEVNGVTYYKYTLVFPKAAYDMLLSKNPNAVYAEICTSVGTITDGTFEAKPRTFMYFDNFVIATEWKDTYDFNDGSAPTMFQVGQQCAGSTVFANRMVERTAGDFEWEIQASAAVTQIVGNLNVDYLAYAFDTKGAQAIQFTFDTTQVGVTANSWIAQLKNGSNSTLAGIVVAQTEEEGVYTIQITKEVYETKVKGQETVRFAFYARNASNEGIALSKADFIYIDDIRLVMEQA